MVKKLHRNVGEGGHGAIWTVTNGTSQRPRSGIVAKVFHTDGCLEWETFGNTLVWTKLSPQYDNILKFNTCLLKNSITTVQLRADGPHEKLLKGLMYRRIDGLTMDGKRRRAQQNILPEDAFSAWVNHLVHIVHVFHSCNIIHNDIKPANVMVEKGVPVLLDFGITCELLPGMDIRKENTTELYMDPGTLCFRKMRKRTRQMRKLEEKSSCEPHTVSDIFKDLRKKWNHFPWKQLDDLASKYLDVTCYSDYAQKQLFEDRKVSPQTRDIYALGMSVFEMSIQTYGYLIPSMETFVAACIRIGPEAFTSLEDVLSACIVA